MIRNLDAKDVAPHDRPETTSPTNLLRVAWQRKSLIILGLVIGFVGGAIFYSQRPRVYQSGTQVLVIKKRPDVLNMPTVESTMFTEDYLATHMVLIRSPAVVVKAVKKLQDSEAVTLRTLGSDPLNAIMGGLQVTREIGAGSRGTNILNLAFRGPYSDECRKILEAVVAAYREYLEETYKNVSDEALQQITQANSLLTGNMRKLTKELNDFYKDRSTPYQWKSTTLLNPELAQMQALYNKQSELAMRRIELESQRKTIEMAMKQDQGEAALLMMSQRDRRMLDTPVQRSAGVASEEMFKLGLERARLLERLGPDHPEVKDVESRIALTEKYLASRSEAEAASVEKLEKNRANKNPVVLLLQSINLDLARIEDESRTISDKLVRETTKAREIYELEAKERIMLENLDSYRKLVNSIADKLNQYQLVKDLGGYDARPIMEPTIGQQVEPRAVPVFMMAAFLGVAAGVGLAYLADITDKSFRSPDEIRRRLGLPVVGHIPSLITEDEERLRADNPSGLDPALCTYFKPKSRKSEVFRGIRTALYFSTRGEGHKVIQITSPNMGDGKTTLSTNLAVSIAQSGKRTLIIDADFRRPRIHKVYNLPNDVGFASVIMGQAELRDAIQPTIIPGLSVLSSGPIPPNPAELLTSPRVKELLDDLREMFDFIIVDTPPLLVVTDPCVVAPRVDGVLMAIRVAKNSRPVAERAREVLGNLGANVLGVVVNGVNLFGPEGYGYGYGYSYGYQYGQYDYTQAYQYKYEYSDKYYQNYTDDGYYEDRIPEGENGSPGPVASLHRDAGAPGTATAPQPNAEKPAGGGWLNQWFKRK